MIEPHYTYRDLAQQLLMVGINPTLDIHILSQKQNMVEGMPWKFDSKDSFITKTQ